jgi:hypothetical protein
MDDGQMTSINYVRINGGNLVRNGQALAATGSNNPVDMYHALHGNYPKFFKMDRLCKWAWLAAEVLLKDESGAWLYDGLDKRNIAVVLATKDGCLEVDHRYQETMESIPSPALFVYTLPNIMLGEICIRHGFTGEQLCEVQEAFDLTALLPWVHDLAEHRGVTHCLFGWADAVGDNHEVTMYWMDAKALQSVTLDRLQTVHNKPL